MSNPTLAVWPLSVDLAGHDRSGAVSLTGVDPIRYDNGLWLEEGTTNLIVNASAEAGTTGWTPGGTSTIERVLGSSVGVTPKHGSYVFKATRNSHANVFTWAITFAAAGTYTYRLPLWIPSGASPNSSTMVRISSFTGGTTVSSQLPDLAVRDEWQHSSVTFTLDAGDLAGFLAFDYAALAGEFVYLDAPQVEEKPYSTSFAESSLGAGYSSGSGGVHVRAASSASVATANHLDPSSGSVAFRVTPTIETGVEEIWGECGTKGTGTDHIQWGRDASKHPFVEWSSDDGSYQRLTSVETADAGIEHFVLIGHNGTDVFIKAAGGARESGTRDAVEGSFGAGDLVLKASVGGNVVGPLATFNRMLTDAEIYTVEHTEHWSMGMLGNEMVRRIRAQFELRPAY